MFKRNSLMAYVVAGTLALPATAARADFEATIGVYFDPAGTVCSGTIEAGVPGNIYIVAKTPPGQAMRAAGAEFRFTGLPPAWLVYPVADPSIFTIGNPFGDGVSLASSVQCYPGGSDDFLMFSVLVLADETLEDVRFDIEGRNPPLNPRFACPLVSSCDGPAFTLHCVSTSSCFVNSTTPEPCAATSAVREMTWTGLRQLYQ